LELIITENPRKSKKEILELKRKYLDLAFTKHFMRFDPEDIESVKRFVFFGIKSVALSDHNENEKDYVFIIAQIVEAITLLTPNEFVNMFPIDKTYDGDKWEIKDYFYTRDYIDTLEKDVPFGDIEETLNLFWEYQNSTIRRFSVKYLCATSHKRRQQGLPTFAEMAGIETHQVYKDANGTNYLMIDGQPVPLVKKKKESHLKVIK